MWEADQSETVVGQCSRQPGKIVIIVATLSAFAAMFVRSIGLREELHPRNFDHPDPWSGPKRCYLFAAPITASWCFASIPLEGYREEKLPFGCLSISNDVRDLALPHLLAMQMPEAGDKLFFLAKEFLSNKRSLTSSAAASEYLDSWTLTVYWGRRWRQPSGPVSPSMR